MSLSIPAQRLPRWQRWSSYAVLATCATTGVVWFVLMDVFDATPSTTKPWWIGHGIAATLSTLAIGGAMARHVVVNWKLARARVLGATNLALLSLLIATSFFLLYGGGGGNGAAHWLHVGAGLVAVAVFAAHVLVGRSSRSASSRAGRRAPRSNARAT